MLKLKFKLKQKFDKGMFFENILYKKNKFQFIYFNFFLFYVKIYVN